MQAKGVDPVRLAQEAAAREAAAAPADESANAPADGESPSEG